MGDNLLSPIEAGIHPASKYDLVVRAGIGIPARNWFGKSNSRTNLRLFQHALKVNTPNSPFQKISKATLDLTSQQIYIGSEFLRL
jgi:hypothetical protein